MKKISRKSIIDKLGYIHLIVLITLTLLLTLNARADVPPVESSAMADKWGIEILGIRSSAADYMLDFRYRVVDAAKAQALFRRGSRPQLIDQTSGAQMGVYSSPKTGPMRTTNKPKVDRNYIILFANPGRHIKSGNMVTVIIDDFKVDNLVVQ